jgi:hypothetical protein
MLLQDFNDICTCIQNTHLTGNTDALIWRWQGNEKITTHFSYEWLVFRDMIHGI